MRFGRASRRAVRAGAGGGCSGERGAVAEGQLLALPGGQPLLHPGDQHPFR
jgi:hypothetical protein